MPKRPATHKPKGFGSGNDRRKAADKRRGSSSQRGYDWAWQKARNRWIAEHPLCAECARNGDVVAGNEVDHIIPHRGDHDLFWDTRNWQTLCTPHHSSKTAREDGGFGNRIK